MRCLPEPATLRRGRWRRTRVALLTAGAAALAAQLIPWVHTVLAVLVTTSWTLTALLAARALAHRYGLHPPAWASAPAAARVLTRVVRRRAGRLRARQRPPASPLLTAEQDCYELAGAPVMSPASVGER